MRTEKISTSFVVLSIVTALGISLFWLGFFTVGLAPENPPACYFAYEHAFPLPDITMSLVMIAGSLLARRGNPLGRRLLLASGGALVFLGLLDFCFNCQNGMYTLSVVDLFLNGFINLWCIVFGITIVLKLK